MYTVFFFYLWGSLRIWSKYNYFHFVTYTHIHTKTTTYTNIDINKRKKPIEKKPHYHHSSVLHQLLHHLLLKSFSTTHNLLSFPFHLHSSLLPHIFSMDWFATPEYVAVAGAYGESPHSLGGRDQRAAPWTWARSRPHQSEWKCESVSVASQEHKREWMVKKGIVGIVRIHLKLS